MPSDALTLRPLEPTPADIRKLADCFERNGTVRSIEAFEWQYLQNGTGHLFVDVAMNGQEIAAVYASLPIRARIGTRVGLAIQSLDTLTDREFRGQGLFTKLAKQTVSRSTSFGAHFVYGFPNGNSAPGFFNKLGWTNLDPLPMLAAPIRTGYLVNRLLGRGDESSSRLPYDFRLRGTRPPRLGTGSTIEPIAQFDERFSHLWHTFAPSINGVERDAPYLNWRLIAKPGERYINYALLRRGELTAFISFCVKSKHGGFIGYIMEMLGNPASLPDCRSLLSRALAEMARDGADVVLAWCLPHSPTFLTYLRCGFLPLPSRVRPIELHFGARWLSDQSDSGVGYRNRWYISYLDSDTV